MHPMMRSFTGLTMAATAVGLALAMSAPAYADDLTTTNCSEQQMMSSIQQNDPLIWRRIVDDPQLEQELRMGLAVLLAAPPGDRQPELNALEQTLGQGQWTGVSDDIMNSSFGPIGRAVNNCHNF